MYGTVINITALVKAKELCMYLGSYGGKTEQEAGSDGQGQTEMKLYSLAGADTGR